MKRVLAGETERVFKRKKKDEKKNKTVSEVEEVASENDGVLEKKSFLRKIFSLKFMIFFFLAILIVGGAFAGWFFFLKEKSPEEGETAADAVQAETLEQEDGEEDVPPPEPDFPDIVDLDPFEKIKIKESGNLNHITFTISIELFRPELREVFETDMELVRQTIESEVKEMTWLVLRFPEGKLRFKYNLIKHLNTVLSSAMVRNVFITTFILH